MKTIAQTALAACLFLAIATGCSRAPGGNSLGHVRVLLTDAPGDFEEVNIVVTEVSVHHDGGWETVRSEPETFDLLTLTNGVTAMVAEGDVPAGRYTQVRLMVGEGSNVVIGGVTYPLEIPSGLQSGVKLISPFGVPAGGSVQLTVDFDAARSVVLTGDGRYQLKPTIRVVDTQ